MAGLGWSIRHGNMHELNNARKRPYAAAQIACRICDQAFFSTQALLDHIETHMIEDEIAVSRGQHELNLMLPQRHSHFANPLQHNFPLPAPQQHMRPPPIGSGNVLHVLQGWNAFIGATTRDNDVPPLGFSSLGRERLELGPQLPPKSSQQPEQIRDRRMEEPSSDCTKPFLDRLQETIRDVVKHGKNEDGANNKLNDNAEMLDLTLKL